MPRDAREILAETEAFLLREHSYRGTFYLSPIGEVLRLDWASSWGSDTRVARTALEAACKALVAAGYHAETIPGLPWARVIPAPADIIDADDPAAWRDHEHGRDTDRPMAAE